MANSIPNLLVYTPITTGTYFVEDISQIPSIIASYQHTIHLQGGYWTATWKLAADDVGETMYNEWRTNRFFYHFVEQLAGTTTFEGSIELIQPDDDKGIIDCTAYGYVHSIQNKFSTTAAGVTDANLWLEILRAADCEFIQSGELTANTLQCYEGGQDKCWDEMIKVVEVGDGVTFSPWQIGVYQDRRLYYKPVSTIPAGYVRGGVRWRVDGPNDVINFTIVSFTDEAGAPHADVTAGLAESMSRYGTRQEKLSRNRLPVASAQALANQYTYEHMWPYMRAVGCGRDIQVYDSIGCNNAVSPWVIQPGVFMDTTIVGGGSNYLAWLPVGCFLVDEVTASGKGVQLRTSKWEESDAMEAYYDYLNDMPEAKAGKHKHRKIAHGGGVGSPW